ncbi:hypothetical protein G5I_12118 [Acromyrmex echinatior]|uniref:Uncharacterized protein n=1 Tax=Acromyrmex echinatior TaxID=103372 RepID=F4X1I8_ACREC|nr:hypothetical protein G5I_12118 [Acromyrmex echinatior]
MPTTAVYSSIQQGGKLRLNVSLESRDMGRLENFDIRENRGILTPDGRQIDLLCRTSAMTISSNKNQLHFSNEIHSCSCEAMNSTVHAGKRNPLSNEFVKKPGSLRPQGIKRAQHTVSIEFCESYVRASLRLALHFPLLDGFTRHVAVLLFFPPDCVRRVSRCGAVIVGRESKLKRVKRPPQLPAKRKSTPTWCNYAGFLVTMRLPLCFSDMPIIKPPNNHR